MLWNFIENKMLKYLLEFDDWKCQKSLHRNHFEMLSQFLNVYLDTFFYIVANAMMLFINKHPFERV